MAKKKVTQLCKQGFTPNQAAPAQPRQPKTKLRNFPLVLEYLKGAGMKKRSVSSKSAFLLVHNHPTQTPSQKKLLAKLRIPLKHVRMVLDLGNTFMPPAKLSSSCASVDTTTSAQNANTMFSRTTGAARPTKPKNC